MAYTSDKTVAGLDSKATPLDADVIVVGDSADSDRAKKSTWTQIKAFLKTYFDTLYGSASDVATNTAKVSYTDAAKVAGIEIGATADQTGSEIKTAYEGEADTNAFTDAEKALLANQSGTNTGDQNDHGSLDGLADDDHTQYALISSQAGVPSSTPSRVGLVNVDTTNDNVYVSAGTASSADWKQATGLGGGDLLAANNLSDLANAVTARTNLGVDAAGTDNSTDVTLAGAGTYITIAGQVITVDPITESDIADLGAYITGITGEPLSDLSDVTVTSIASGEILKWNGIAWINQTLAEAGIAPALGADDNYVTDAEKVVIGNTSGTNTGDEDATSLATKGALMDSEVTNLAQVKAFSSADYATAAQGTTADNAMQDLSDDTTPTLGGELNAGAHSIGFTTQTATGDGTTTIDWRLGNHMDFTFGAFNETFTFTAPSKSGVYTLSLKQDSVGSRTATWPASVKWPAGTAPTLTTTASTGYDVISFRFDGTSFYGVSTLNFS